MDRDFLHSLALFFLRVGASAMMFFGHGLAKIANYRARAEGFADPLGIGSEASFALAAFAEGICTILVALGIRTRWAAVPVIITMLVAGFIQHAADPWRRKELAFLYAACFVAILILGPGRFSLDALIGKKRA